MIYQKAVRLIALILLSAVLGVAGAQAETDFKQSSVLSSGRWIKVRVDHTDIYRISHSTLREWGFSNPDNVVIAGYGSVERAHTLDSAPDDLPLVPLLRGKDAIYFFGEGDSRVEPSNGYDHAEHRNLYSSGSYYFVSESAVLTPPAIDEALIPEVSAPGDEDDDDYWNIWNHPEELDAPDSHIVIDRRRYRDHHPYHSSAFWFSENIASSNSVSETWDISDYVSGGKFSYQVVGFPDDTNRYPQSLTFDGHSTVSAKSVSGLKGTSSSHVTYVAGPLNTYTFQKGDSDSFSAEIRQVSGDMDFCSVNHMTLSFNAGNIWRAPAVVWDIINKGSEDAIVIDNTPQNAPLHVWDVTDPRAVLELEQRRVSDSRTAVPANPRNRSWQRVCVFTESDDIAEPTPVGEIANQNLHALPAADLLIVATDNSYASALRLAEAHRTLQGLEVAVVRQNEVYNEFSSGVFHPNAIRRLVMMLSSRNGSKLRHLLLMGHGLSRPLSIDQECPDNYLATYHTEDVDEDRWESKNNSSDSYFTILKDRIPPSICDPDYILTVNVGRAQVSSASEADDFVDKCIEYLEDPFMAGYYGETMLLGCKGDKNQHLTNILRQESVLRNNLDHPTIHHIHYSAFPATSNQVELTKTAFRNNLAGRTSFFNYSGHSTDTGFGALAEINIALNDKTYYGSYPLVYLSSCSTSRIDLPASNIGSKMSCSRRGPIAVVGASREVYMANNHNLNNAFVDALASAGPDATIGDVFTAACNNSHGPSSVTGAREQVINNSCYGLLGNPALPLYVPSGKVMLEDINSTPASDINTVHVSAGTPVVISGTVRKPDGSIDTEFNGVMRFSVYAPEFVMSAEPVEKTDKEEAAANGKKQLRIGDRELYSGAATVESGRWSVTFSPEKTSSTDVNRIRFQALSSSRAIAAGTSMAMIVGDSESEYDWADSEAPQIEMWIGRPGCGDGSVVDPDTRLHIGISDSGSGLRLNNTSVGSAPKVMLDGAAIENSTRLFVPGSDGSLVMERELANLTEGMHTLEVIASDIAGNKASETFRFIVQTDFNVELSVAETLVRECADFDISTSSASYTDARIVIRDSHGTTVFSRRNVAFPFAWDLRDNNGATVADGLYRASVLIDASPRLSASPEVEFTVVKPNAN